MPCQVDGCTPSACSFAASDWHFGLRGPAYYQLKLTHMSSRLERADEPCKPRHEFCSNPAANKAMQVRALAISGI